MDNSTHPVCKNCKSFHVVKNGRVRQKQRFLCKDCGITFVEGDGRTNPKIAAKKALIVLLYSLSKGSYNMLARIFHTWPSLVYRWVREAGAELPEPALEGEIKEIEIDELWHFIQSKKTSFGSSKRLIVAHGELWPGCSAIRDTATFQRLYDKLRHLTNCHFYTDNWDAFAKVLPKDRHSIGKEHTIAIEQDNSNTRHHLGRFTRRTKVVSKSPTMVDYSLKLWLNMTDEQSFKKWQDIALSIFK